MVDILKNPVVFGVRRLFILVSPNETSFEKLEDVPNYVEEVGKMNFILNKIYDKRKLTVTGL